MKRRSLDSPDGTVRPEHLAEQGSKVLSVLPALIQHCSVTRYEDASPRRPGWVTISTLGASWCVKVKDPDACAQLSCMSVSLDDALVLADLLLSSDDAPWEPDPFLRANQPRRK